VIGESEPLAAALPEFDVVDGYTIARPRRADPSTGPSVQLDDGQLVPIGGLVLLGRDPTPAPGESVDRLVPLADASRGLSKTHAGLVVDGGLLWVTDRHSTNGTAVRSAAGQERACPPGERVQVEIGDTVVLGGRALVRVH
jgi:pSer/pThr/pTyr-binding forkhead associated (FHA) protein